MIIEQTDQVKAEIEHAAAERSESDERSYTLSNLIVHGSALVSFQNCETFTAPPFDRCRTDMDKRRMLASMMAMGAAYHLDKLSAPAVAENYGIIDSLYRQMKEFEPAYLYDDPYLRTVSLPLGEKNGFLFGIEDVRKGQLFHYDGPAEDGYADIPRLGYFHQDVRYPLVSKEGKLIAALNPSHFETMKKHVSVASGNVLCLGLKLGYFPFLASMKESVKTVTVIEKDSGLVQLFEELFLSQFPHAEKIIVLNDDPLTYLQNEWPYEYRHVFSSSGYDAMSSVHTYMEVKKLEKLHKKTKFTYWLEESILADIKSTLLLLLVGQHEENPEEFSRTLTQGGQGEEMLNEMRAFADSLHIQSAKDVKSLFANKSLARQIARFES